MNNNFKVTPLRRLLAYLVDHMILILLYSIPINYIHSLVTQKIEIKITLDMLDVPFAILAFSICAIISFYYLIYAPVYRNPGTTIGKRIFGIKVVKEDNSNVDLSTMFIREAIGIILIEGAIYPVSEYFHILLGILMKVDIQIYLAYIFSSITIISVIYALFNKSQAMFHDRLAKTKVILINK